MSARIDAVDTQNLRLGAPSPTYITLTNTGNVPIVKERIEITAGKDFGFLIGYRSRTFIHEYHQEIAPGESRILEDQFNLPLYEGFVSLEGIYDVKVKLTINDVYYVGDWEGKVPLLV